MLWDAVLKDLACAPNELTVFSDSSSVDRITGSKEQQRD